MTATRPAPLEFRLDDRYRREHGDVYLTGVQALVRVIMERARLDRRAELSTGSYVSGYEGSPLAGLDLELARWRALLEPLGVHHEPGLNEELAATAVAGTQLARTVARLRPSGVTGYWYGKAPGLDRATDALRHANLIGTDPAGGAVAFVGDDPAAKSSSVPCSSEFALADMNIPTLVPADAADVLDLGRHAVELSRVSGLWTALRIATVVADGSSTAAVADGWTAPVIEGLDPGLRPYRHRPSAHLLGGTLAELERSFHHVRLPLAQEYLRRSGINRVEGAGQSARVGLVAAGPTYLALRHALGILGLDDEALRRLGIRLLRLGAVHPLEPTVVRTFAAGLQRVLVVEDKRAFLEHAVKTVLYGSGAAPGVDGKQDANGRPLLSPLGELDADAIVQALARWLPAAGIDGIDAPQAAPERRQLQLVGGAARAPFFCSGCPHNSSTEVAPGTLVGGGIGCHAMLLLMPGERSGTITGLTQMGGEGAQWIGMAPFVEPRHFVQNMGDGTFAHSGSLAVRAAVAAGANVTFKLLRNSAVAMTGGQRPVGELGLRQMIDLLKAEGVRHIVVTTDAPAALRRSVGRDVDIRSRDDLLPVQRELAQVEGVTALIHDQECAAEKRRSRRRGRSETPPIRAFINERVCEGCGDCGSKSNCLSVQPVPTELGRKTRINQSSCNLDFSCLDGDCPAFVTVTPQNVAKPRPPDVAAPDEPLPLHTGELFRARITGIGGTGVVTVAQVLATAAVMVGRRVRTLDQTGLAQKGGAVVSDIVVSETPLWRSPKLAAGECDLYLGCDALVAADAANLKVADRRGTTAVVSTSPVPTGQMVVDPTVTYPSDADVSAHVRRSALRAEFVDAAGIARRHLDDEQYANVVLLGVAYQTGAVPIPAQAIEAAIRLNGAAVDANLAAFRLGRRAIVAPRDETTAAAVPADLDLEALVGVREADLVAYQDRRYAAAYREVVDRVRAVEAQTVGGARLTREVAGALYKIMAYKDEYEVARLSLDPRLDDDVAREFGPGATYRYRLHPPALRALGMKHKMSLGPWARPVFRILVGARRLRGTPFDPFGAAKVRVVERALIVEYRWLIDRLLRDLTPANHDLAVELAALPDLIRGYEQLKLRNVDIYRSRLTEMLHRYEAEPAITSR